MGVRISNSSRRKAKKKTRLPEFLERWGSSIFVLALLAVTAHVLFGSHGLLAMRRAQMEVESLRQEIAQTQKENRELADQIQALKTDPRIIERIAREEMGLAKPGELIFKLPPKPSVPKP